MHNYCYLLKSLGKFALDDRPNKAEQKTKISLNMVALSHYSSSKSVKKSQDVGMQFKTEYCQVPSLTLPSETQYCNVEIALFEMLC